jgi:hypothetical protein
MQPLLELIQHQQHLSGRIKESSLTQGNQRLDQTESRRQVRHLPAQALEQVGFGFVSGRLDIAPVT